MIFVEGNIKIYWLKRLILTNLKPRSIFILRRNKSWYSEKMKDCYAVIYSLSVFTRNIWKSLLHGCEFQVCHLFHWDWYDNVGKIFIGLGKLSFLTHLHQHYLGYAEYNQEAFIFKNEQIGQHSHRFTDLWSSRKQEPHEQQLCSAISFQYSQRPYLNHVEVLWCVPHWGLGKAGIDTLVWGSETVQHHGLTHSTLSFSQLNQDLFSWNIIYSYP